MNHRAMNRMTLSVIITQCFSTNSIFVSKILQCLFTIRQNPAYPNSFLLKNCLLQQTKVQAQINQANYLKYFRSTPFIYNHSNSQPKVKVQVSYNNNNSYRNLFNNNNNNNHNNNSSSSNSSSNNKLSSLNAKFKLNSLGNPIFKVLICIINKH